MSNRVLITGANRGIGLEFTRQYLRDDWTVYATCRRPDEADDLHNLPVTDGQLYVDQLDVTESRSIDGAFRSVSEREDGLELLINNAGIYGNDAGFEDLDADDVRDPFEVNCLGPFQVTQTFLPLLKSVSGNVVFMTSLMGSVEDNRSGGSYPYRISKAALNMLGKTFSEDYSEQDIYTAILHPGWVQTRMGGEGAKISVEESVSGLRSVIDDLDAERSGEFYAYDGEKRPW
jgi:NAD(P)-dependent dehydrogenase (short-subunit alcohol dehydrogenase family)